MRTSFLILKTIIDTIQSKEFPEIQYKVWFIAVARRMDFWQYLADLSAIQKDGYGWEGMILSDKCERNFTSVEKEEKTAALETGLSFLAQKSHELVSTVPYSRF